MVKIFSELSIFLLFFMATLTIQGNDQIKPALLSAGFENIRVVHQNDVTYISIEDNQYRWYVDGVSAAIDTILLAVPQGMIFLVVLEKGVPRYQITIKNSKEGLAETVPELSLSYDIASSWKILKEVSPSNRSEYKVDVVVHPQFNFRNTNFDKTYHTQLNISPEVKTSLWRGMLLSGQLIFPVMNDLNQEGNYIRPGFVTISQEFRFWHNWFACATIGNFNAERYGADLRINHPFLNSNWNLGFNAGFTGSSNFMNGNWENGKLNTYTGGAFVGYFYPRFNLQTDVGMYRHTGGNYAVRADFTRHFGEKSIGFYVIYGKSIWNAGFHFAVPLTFAKRTRKHDIRIVPAKYFDMEYNAGTDFNLFHYYETRPSQNRSEHWSHIRFISNQLIKSVYYEEKVK